MNRFVLLLAAFAFASIASAANVALFADTAYVDYDPGNSDAEASNMQRALQRSNTVSTFIGVTAVEWTAALAGQDVLVIPEQENGDLAPALPPATITVIQNFVNGGGRLIVAEDYAATLFLNAVFGYTLVNSSGGTSTYDSVAAAGTPFTAGPASLPDNDAVNGMSIASLPAGAKCVYVSAPDCMMFTVTYGSGRISYLGWDWFDAQPVGSQDGGWNTLLVSAAAGVPTVYVAQSTAKALPVPTLAHGVQAMLALLLAALGAALLRRRAQAPR